MRQLLEIHKARTLSLRNRYNQMLEELARRQRAEFEARLAQFGKGNGDAVRRRTNAEIIQQFSQIFPGGAWSGGRGGNQGDIGGGGDLD